MAKTRSDQAERRAAEAERHVEEDGVKSHGQAVTAWRKRTYSFGTRNRDRPASSQGQSGSLR